MNSLITSIDEFHNFCVAIMKNDGEQDEDIQTLMASESQRNHTLIELLEENDGNFIEVEGISFFIREVNSFGGEGEGDSIGASYVIAAASDEDMPNPKHHPEDFVNWFEKYGHTIVTYSGYYESYGGSDYDYAHWSLSKPVLKIVASF